MSVREKWPLFLLFIVFTAFRSLLLFFLFFLFFLLFSLFRRLVLVLLVLALVFFLRVLLLTPLLFQLVSPAITGLFHGTSRESATAPNHGLLNPA